MSDLTEALEALLTVEPSDRASAIEQLARVHSRAAVLSLGAILYSQPAENLTDEKRRAIKTLGRSVSVDAVDVLRGYMASTANLEATVMAVDALRESTDPQVRKAAEALLLDILQDPGTTTRVPDSEQATLVENILEALSNVGSSRAVSVIFEVGFESNASPHRPAAAALATIDSEDVVAQALEMLRSRAEELDLEAQDSLLLILTERPLRRERVPEIRKVLFEVVKRVPGTALTEPRQRLLAKVIDSPAAVRETEALAVAMDFSVPPMDQILTSIGSVVDRRPGLAEPFASLLTAVSDGPNLPPLRPTVVAALQQLGERKLHSVCRALLRSEAACANLAEETLQPFTATPQKALQCIPIWLSLTATAKREHRISVLLEGVALRAGPAMLENLGLRRLVLKPLGALVGTNSRAATSRAQAIARGCLDSFKQGAAGTSLEEATEQLTDSLVTCWKATRFRKGAQTFGDSLLRVDRQTFLPLFLQRAVASLRSSERWALLYRTWIRDQLSREDTSLVGEAIRQAFLRTPDNEWVLEVLTALRYEVSASIAEVLQRPALSVKLKLRFMELLEQINDPADASTLMAVLPNERDAVRERAVTALGEMFSHSRTNAIPPNAMVDTLLLRLAEDPKPAVRGAAAAALGKIADQKAMDGLRASATSDHRNTKQGTTVSQIAREALTSLFDRYSAEKPSTDAPSDLASWVRLIGAIGDRRGVRLVKDLISHPTLEVRLSAVTSLGELGDDSVLPILRNLAEEQEFADRMVNTIAEALQRITGRGDLELTGLLREVCADSTELRRFDVSEDLGRLIRSARQGQIKLAARDALENREQGSYSDEVMHLDALADLFLRAFLEFRSKEVFEGDTVKQHKVVYEQDYGIRITYGPFRRLYPELSEMLSEVHHIRVRSPTGHPEDKKTGKPKKEISDHEVAHARQQLALAIDHILAVVRSNVPRTAPQAPKRA